MVGANKLFEAHAPLHVFIDSNVYLSFFAYPKADLSQPAQIPVLIKAKALILYITDQVCDEFVRNREAKIAECIDSFSKAPLSAKVPLVLDSFDEATNFKAACRAAERNRNKLIQDFRRLAIQKELNADIVIKSIFESAVKLPTTEKLYLAALQRQRKGNPPGKKDSLGDQLNWECLLINCPEKTTLHVVSTDSDFRSVLTKTDVKEFIGEEWQTKKNAKLLLYDDIGIFLGSVDEKIKLATHGMKESRISNLVDSGSFASTHKAISELEQVIPLLTDQEIEILAHGAVNNDQISWISGDKDVMDFYQRILKDRLEQLSPELRSKIQKMFFGPHPQVDNNDIF